MSVKRIIETLSSKQKADAHRKIAESSLSRIWQHVEDDNRSFGVLSPYRADLQSYENEENYAELKRIVRQEMGYGYIELRGGYKENHGDVEMVTEEESLFIPNISRSEIIELGQRYNQDSVIHKDRNSFAIVSTSDRTGGVGSILVDFKKGAGRDNIDLAKEAVKEFFSALLKGSHRGRKFVFTVEEQIHRSSIDRYYLKEPIWKTIHEEEVEV